MNSELQMLLYTAAAIGFLHTLLGPDHYIPFAAMSRAKGWSMSKTMLITTLCGIGHILGSVLLGVVGILFGFSLSGLTAIEGTRGSVAAWLLIAFGLVYFVWGVRRINRSKRHNHLHSHANGVVHSHAHNHSHGHRHLHEVQNSVVTSPWLLFIVFAFGPCEALIPLLMYPAAQINMSAVALVIVVFAAATLFTMAVVVWGLCLGLKQFRIERYSHFAHAMTGVAILLCGAGMQFLGL